jgi:peptidoglycan/LPS O-acetylase OafA/YrhL
MPSVAAFRGIIVLEVLFVAVAWMVADGDADDYALGAGAYWATVTAMWVLIVGLAIGLCLFSRVARIVYTILTLVLLAVTPFFPNTELVGRVEALFTYLTDLCTGAILALMWLSPPIRQVFKVGQPNSKLERDAPEAARPSA